ncbi:C-C motif chemokine 18-like [Neoarius graeffei]|uniref:C-C motif chemokine 18-like n=1 Tax=Neoarius graeffei TaxID=443677 RepID=UPI00298C5D65|nr:C-C motif chemokine 18-like [Neoarius graeffei]
MVFRSLLLGLLVLTCLQSFTMAEHAKEVKKCCVSYQTSRIPVKRITAYEETDIRCTNPGVIFTLKNGKVACANPKDKWVQRVMKINELKKHEITILSSTQPSV